MATKESNLFDALQIVLFLVSILGGLIAAVGYIALFVEGYSGEQFDTLYGFASALGASPEDPLVSFMCFCAYNRRSGLIVFAVAQIAILALDGWNKSKVLTNASDGVSGVSSSPNVVPALVNTWVREGNRTYYAGLDGRPVINSLIEHDDKRYYVDGLGNPVKNQWIELNGTRYYFGELGFCVQTLDAQSGAVPYPSQQETKAVE